MSKIAIIGAGGSAETFLNHHPQVDFDVYTTSGEGELRGVAARKLSSLKQNDYDEIYILIYVLHEIITSFDFDNLTADIYWFDGVEKQLYPIKDPYGESLTAHKKKDEARGLTILYDFRVEPVTFDFLVFLAEGDMERRKRGLDYLNLIFAPGDFAGFNEQWSIEDEEEKQYRLHHLIYPSVQLLDCKVYIHHCATRKQARILWESMDERFPEQHNFLKPQNRHRFNIINDRIQKGENHWVFNAVSSIYKNQVNAWCQTRGIDEGKLVTITMRETFRATARNVDLGIWFDFADYLNSKGYDVVFVRDTSKAFETLSYKGRHHVFTDASHDLLIRAALYNKARMNFSTSNGTNTLHFLTESNRYFYMGIINNLYSECTEKEIRELGFTEDKVPGANPWQNISWEPASLEGFKQALHQLENTLNDQ